MKSKYVILSGYFDPLHVGHLEMIERAKDLGDSVIVIVNNHDQALLKKGYEFMPEEERIKIVRALRHVDLVVPSIDKDLTVRKSLEHIAELKKASELVEGAVDLIFANGGDRHQGEYPEAELCRRLEIEMVDGLGDKIQSSSALVTKAREHHEKIRDRESIQKRGMQ